MKKKLIWLSYDLGIGGDYEGLYKWLDSHKADECGPSLAVIKDYTVEKDLIKEITEEIRSNIKIDNNTRIYIIYRDDIAKTIKGRFIFGGRKRAPWEGYAMEDVPEETEVD